MSFGSLRLATGMLAAAMTLAAAIAPPGFRHRHPLDDQNQPHHDHCSPHERALHAEHDHGYGGHTHQHKVETHRHPSLVHDLAEGVASDLWHIHIVLFGCPVTLPDPHPEDDDDRSNGQPVFVSLRGCNEPILHEMSSRPTLEPRDAGPAVPFAVVVAQRQPQSATSPPEHLILLCDSARRERSGVLLA